jgi:hypothetical protein
MAIRYHWDARKSATNLRKHGVTFERAVRIFEGFILEHQDDRHDYDEIREVAIGLVETDEILVVFTELSDEDRRIISARRASRRERERYWQARRRND